MPERELAVFALDEQTSMLVEVVTPEDRSITRVSRSGRRVLEARQTFDQVLDQVQPVANRIMSKLKGLATPADEVEVKFGIKLSADAGAIFTSVGGEASFEITLKWERQEDKENLQGNA